MEKVFSKIFMWMFVGLLVTFGTSFYVATQENMLYNIFNTGTYWFIIIAELALVFILSARAHKMNFFTAAVMFIIYSMISGLTFSIIFVAFEISSIILIFGITAAIFGLFAVIGYTTNLDLSKISTLLFMGLVGIILATIVNMFLQNQLFDIILSWIGIIVFIGFIAYDIQKIKRIIPMIENQESIAIVGALQLYLDFINIFIRLLSLFGKSRD
ncbi:MAG: Bax inhibitor-1/YccA family protein [Bacilli bacterium]|nr:Bax inhibitor-1/YccA family protein [Bacilli bacterium]MDD4808645.1 Bax inhibitor-1/YccA family protein [Bacilli bacterium]